MPQASEKVKNPKNLWVIMAVAYLASFSGSVMMNKEPPMLPVLVEAFSLNYGKAGLLASVFALAGALFAIPTGLIIQRIGLKITGLLALAFLVVGAIVGALSNTFGIFIFGRVLEGIGTAVISVVAAAAIAIWFPIEKRGMLMGLLTTAGPISAAIIMPLAPALIPSIGWRGVWWVSAGIGIVVMVFFSIFMRNSQASVVFGIPGGSGLPGIPGIPDVPGITDVPGDLFQPHDPRLEPGSSNPGHPHFPGGPEAGPSLTTFGDPKASVRHPLIQVLAKRNMLLLFLCLMAFSSAMMGLIFYYPSYLAMEAGLELTTSGIIAGIIGFMALPVSPLCGWLSDRLGSRKRVAMAGFATLSVVYLFALQATGWQVWVVAVLLGAVTGLVPPVIMAAVPEALDDDKLVPVGVGLTLTGTSVALIIAPPSFGWLVDHIGWANTGYAFAPIPLIAVFLMAMYKEKKSPTDYALGHINKIIEKIAVVD